LDSIWKKVDKAIIVILIMSLLMNISTVISVLNVAVLLTLLVIYAKIYFKSKAVFTIGLMFFTVMLMLHNFIAIYAYLVMAPLYPNDLLPYFVAIHVAELIGIIALLRVTL
jgi:hypothetical protein